MHRPFQLLILAVTVVLLLSPSAKARESDVGIVLMHGKWGGPTAPPIQSLATDLRAKGFKVVTPVMPWGRQRMYDVDYPTALSEIELAAEDLRKKGARRIIVAGHSFGANASIAYAASGREIDGVMAIAPGHVPDLGGFQSKVASSVEKARQMVAEGKGDATATFNDLNQGQTKSIRTTAITYLSFFDPVGLASMPKSAAAIVHAVPFLWVIGSQDRLLANGEDYVFNKAPKHPNSKYLVVSGGHRDTPSVAADQIVEWLMSLGY
jgi:pimeloyl-ACP methyl ester carboxylesterase